MGRGESAPPGSFLSHIRSLLGIFFLCGVLSWSCVHMYVCAQQQGRGMKRGTKRFSTIFDSSAQTFNPGYGTCWRVVDAVKPQGASSKILENLRGSRNWRSLLDLKPVTRPGSWLLALPQCVSSVVCRCRRRRVLLGECAHWIRALSALVAARRCPMGTCPTYRHQWVPDVSHLCSRFGGTVLQPIASLHLIPGVLLVDECKILLLQRLQFLFKARFLSSTACRSRMTLGQSESRSSACRARANSSPRATTECSSAARASSFWASSISSP